MKRELFDTGWEYIEGRPFFGLMTGPMQPVVLPHDASIGKPRSPDSPAGGGGAYAWNGVITYRKRFVAPPEWQDQVVQLEFEGVMMHAEVVINGHYIAAHPYGYTSFVVNLEPYLKCGGENEVLVIANNAAQPNSRWYRHVWLLLAPPTHIPAWGVFVSTPVVSPEQSTIAICTEVTNTSTRSTHGLVRSSISDAAGQMVAHAEIAVVANAQATVSARQQIQLHAAQLWSPETPWLYTLHSELVIDGVVVDRSDTTFGIRSILIDPINGLRLNGQPIKLKGGCVHHDHGLLGAASYDRAEERKIELMKSAGFNALRSAHNPPAPALLDACDRLGMLVINESFDIWRVGKNINDYHLHFEAWWQRDTESMVRRDRNHPAVIMWSIGNEIVECAGTSDGDTWSWRQAELVRSLDPTRPVTQGMRILFEEFFLQMAQSDQAISLDTMGIPAAPTAEHDSWGTRTERFIAPLDVVGYNYLTERYQYDRSRFPERVICGTETWPRFAFESWQATLESPHVIGDFVWTALDYLGESGIGQVVVDQPMRDFQAAYPYHLANCGDFDICGWKRPQSYYRDILWGVRSTPFIAVLPPEYIGRTIRYSPWGWEPVIASWSFAQQEGAHVRVDVYSADQEVALFLNGQEIGRKAPQRLIASFDLAYTPGTLEAIGYRDGQISGRTTLSSCAAPVALRITPDRSALQGSSDLSYLAIEVVDHNGAVVHAANPLITIACHGDGEVIAIGSANPRSEELYIGSQRHAYEGRLMAVVRSNGSTGSIQVHIEAAGLAPASITLTTTA
ncbi:MAG: glycoside hydrolase family 2 TIM barrel-domain containing protein [Roseiflexaceae bacterium]